VYPEEDPKQDKRRLKGFDSNLNMSDLVVQQLGIQDFTTTLTMNRHTSSRDIFSQKKLPARYHGYQF